MRRREEVVPPELADSTDAFGLLRRSIPRRIGRNDGPKARVLVRLPPLQARWVLLGDESLAAPVAQLLPPRGQGARPASITPSPTHATPNRPAPSALPGPRFVPLPTPPWMRLCCV